MFRKKIEKYFTDKVRASCTEDWNSGRLERTISVSKLATFLSVIVLSIPFIFLCLGIWVIGSDYTLLRNWIYGGLILFAAYVTFPKPYKFEEGLETRDKLPKLFELLDEISLSMGSKEQVTHVAFSVEANAYMGTRISYFGRSKHVLGIGFLLWDRLDSDEKCALIGHELAHLANKDPARGRLQYRAVESLAAWYSIFSVDAEDIDFFNFWFMFFIAAIGRFIEEIAVAILSASNLSSQRAEYFSDALAAERFGKSSMASLLRGLAQSSALEKSFSHYHPTGSKDHDGGAIFSHFANLFHTLPIDEKNDAIAEDRKENASVDDTHPPTWMRINFIEQINVDEQKKLNVSADTLADIDEEIQKYREKCGKELFGYFVDMAT